MTLGELVEYLEKENPNKTVPLGFHNPHSYRGYYSELGFEPRENVKIKTMLKCAHSALGETYQGWKGGEFTMEKYTNVFLAKWGSCGEEMGICLLNYMTGKYSRKE